MRASVVVAALALALAGAGRADDAAVLRAFQAVDGQTLPEAEAHVRLHALVAALDEAGLPRSAAVALATLAADEKQSEAVRSAAREELIVRAARDGSLAQSLLARMDGAGKLPPQLALRLARSHLERALQLSPLEEGVAFTGVARGPAVANASVEEVPLDPELAKEMGEPRSGEPAAKPASEDREPVTGTRAKFEIDRARALAASIPAGDPAAVDGHEISGLAALALGEADGAEKEFLAVVQAPRTRGDGERRDRAFLQLARLTYQRGDDARATQLYEKVGRGAPEWLDALFEATWAHFRTGDDEHALGNLLTLHAPFFQGRFFPESFVLKALVLYENCRYGEARASLVEFAQRYQPLHDGLAATLVKLPTPQTAYDFLAGGAVRIEAVPAAAREELARLAQDADLTAGLRAVQELAQEIDSFDRRQPQLRASSFAGRVLPLARQARLSLLETTGRRLQARIDSERAELGSYRFQLGQRCKKPRAAPMQAREPDRQEPRAAAGQ